MPTFNSPRPQGLAQSFATLLAGNDGGMTLDQAIKVNTANSKIAHDTALAEKVRAEVEQMRSTNRLRGDRGAQVEYGARAAGINVPDATRLEQNFRAESIPPLTANDDEGNPMPDAPIQAPNNITPQQAQLYRAAVASILANNMATGKTNANQLTQAGGNILTDGFRAQLTAPGVTPAQRTGLIEAVSEKPVMPFDANSAGTSVTNKMTGETATPSTLTAQFANELTKQRGRTEEARQIELRSGAGHHSASARAQDALVPLRQAQTRNVGAGGRAFKPVDPVQAEKRISDMTLKEYETLPRAQKKTMTLEQYRNKRRAEIGRTIQANGGGDIAAEINEARKAISEGADPAAVKARFRQRTKADLPDDDEAD